MMNIHKLNRTKHSVINLVQDIFELGLMVFFFAVGFWLFCTMIVEGAHAEAVEPVYNEYGDVILENGHVVTLPVVTSDEIYTDSHGATATGWEIEEAIRKIMLEAGGESEADIRAHVEVDLKRLLYCQVVGGYDDWGTSLWGVTHSHGFLETNTRLWTPDAEPTDLVRAIWWDVWWNGYLSDFRVQNYKKDWYHDPLWSIPAFSIGASYYSINKWQDFSMFDLDENGVLSYPDWAWGGWNGVSDI